MEYCAPGIPKSEVIGIARLISTLQAQIIQAGGPVSFEQAQRAAQLDAIRPVLVAQKIQSLIAVPLMEGGEHVGIIILEQCVTPRAFRKVDEDVLANIAEQIVLAPEAIRDCAISSRIWPSPMTNQDCCGALLTSTYYCRRFSAACRKKHR